MSYIGLMDCNNFFVSCERLFRPDLWGKPVAVLSSNDGVIVARSNELKAMGVPMGLPLFQAKKLVDFKDVTLFSSNFTLYRDISSRVMKVLTEEVGQCEIYSIDEAFFILPESVTEADITALRTRIMGKVGIPVSIGVAKTKTLAKVGSEIGKKGSSGVCVVSDNVWRNIAKGYPCSEVWNLGRATSAKLRAVGVETAADFLALDQSYVEKTFGVGGRRVQEELKGRVVHKVGANIRDLPQSIMSTRSFAKITHSRSELESALSYHVSHVAEKLREANLLASKLHVLMRVSRHSDFNLRESTKEVLLAQPTNDTTSLIKAALSGLSELFDREVPYKKAGVTASGLLPASLKQLELFAGDNQPESLSVIDKLRDEINDRFGGGVLRQGLVLKSGPKTSATLRSNEYTTLWKDIPRVKAN